jgi:hypothetical protein
VLLTIERAVATIRSSDPGEMPCHSVGTWPGTTITLRVALASSSFAMNT